MISFNRIVELSEPFPGVEVSTSYGTPALKVGKKLVLRMHQQEDAIVMLLDSVEDQQRLIQDDPMCFYITDHYAGYPAVLIRPIIEEPLLLELLERSWRRVARKKDLDAFNGR